MSDDFPLAAEFPPTTRDDWRRLVEAALKGALFDKRLVSQTYDGLRTEPIRGREHLGRRNPGDVHRLRVEQLMSKHIRCWFTWHPVLWRLAVRSIPELGWKLAVQLGPLNVAVG